MTATTALALVATLTATTPELDPPIEATATEDVDTSNPWVAIGTTALITSAIAVWAFDAWWDDGLGSFKFRDEGAFGRDTYAGGSDKVGHAFSNYVMTHVAIGIYEALGMSKRNAVLWAGGATFLVSNWVELIDGFTDYGFAVGDVIANSAGIGLAVLMAISPTVHDLIGFRISYVPSRDFLENDKSVLKWINDYTGMTYYLDVKAKGVFSLLDEDPGMLRYVQAGVAFNTDQYSPVKRWEQRRRNFGVHVGLSMSEILRAWGDGDEGVEPIAKFFDFYAVPFLNFTLMTDLNSGEWFVNFGIANRFEAPL